MRDIQVTMHWCHESADHDLKGLIQKAVKVGREYCSDGVRVCGVLPQVLNEAISTYWPWSSFTGNRNPAGPQDLTPGVQMALMAEHLNGLSGYPYLCSATF